MTTFRGGHRVGEPVEGTRVDLGDGLDEVVDPDGVGRPPRISHGVNRRLTPWQRQ
jgi:hypothetical protein